MDPFSITCYVIGVLVVYAVVGVTASKSIDTVHDADRVGFGFFWPITLPITLVYKCYVKTVKLVKSCEKFVENKKDQKQLSNLKRPVDVLAMMVVSKIIKYPENWETCPIKWVKDGLTVKASHYEECLISFCFGDEVFSREDLSSTVAKKFDSAIVSSREMKEELKAAESQAARDNKALDVIESFFKD